MAKATQFLRFEDDSGHLVIEGECFDQKHLKEIDVIGTQVSAGMRAFQTSEIIQHY